MTMAVSVTELILLIFHPVVKSVAGQYGILQHRPFGRVCNPFAGFLVDVPSSTPNRLVGRYVEVVLLLSRSIGVVEISARHPPQQIDACTMMHRREFWKVVQKETLKGHGRGSRVANYGAAQRPNAWKCDEDGGA